MVKLISSIVGGLVLAFAIVFVVDALFHALSLSASPRANPNDPDAMREYVARQPIGALAALVLGWAAAVFVGSAVAARFGSRGEWPGWVITGFFLIATSANFIMVQHPAWMMVGAIAAIVAAGWLGSRTGAAGHATRGVAVPTEHSTS